MHAGSVVCLAVALAVMGAVAACGGDDSPSSSGPSGAARAPATTVVIKTFQFNPKPLTVTAGTTVTFRNDDAILHTVTSGVRTGENANTPDGKFDIQLKDAGATGSYDFKAPGVYRFYCKVHPGQGMTGEVDVGR